MGLAEWIINDTHILYFIFLGRMEESGLMHKLELKWFPEETRQWTEDVYMENENFHIGLAEIFAIAMALVAGIALSLLFLILEYLINTIHQLGL